MLNGKRIKEARERAGVSQTTIDLALKAPIGTCCRLEGNYVTIDPDQLGILCDVLKVDRTWLLTGDEKRNEELSKEERVSQYLHHELKRYCKTNRMPLTELARKIGVEYTTVFKICSGNRTPSEELVDLIASKTGVDARKVLLPGEKLNHRRGRRSKKKEEHRRRSK